ncbi:hypothetical protein ACJIZ3_001807 [Penstemon smallii]|uniref:Uncharacterized protein n=1 Tax=Penstemon smallii TaxID=265156 RepID=A0ABD3U4M7_9LAMI
MTTISSFFLQKHSPTSSLLTSPPLQFQFKISSFKIDEKHNKSTHQIPIILTRTSHTPTKQPIHAQAKTTENTTKQSLLTTIFTFLDELICNFIDPPLRPSIDPKHVLSGNYSPVHELSPSSCTVVEGSLPPSLNGVYIRNGPNPQFIPRGPYHLFDGDGMLHSIKISEGKATFCSRFVKTYKYTLEQNIGSPVILNVFSAFNGLPASLARCVVTLGRVITGQYDPKRGIGCANTSLAMFSGKLFALAESDLPYAVKLSCDGDVITLGRHEHFGEPYMTMTAHPKIDTETGETFAFRHNVMAPINAEGIKQPEVPILSLKEASLIHDFAVSENYVVFPDTQIVIKPIDVLKGKSLVGIDSEKVPRLGILSRYAEDEREMWWVEVPGFNMVHTVNAWEEDGGDTIVVVAANVSGVENVLERMDLIHTLMERVEINVKNRTVTRRPVSGRNLDFGIINPGYFGKKNRYMYAAVGDPMPKMAGAVKIDLSLSTANLGDCTVATRLYGPYCYGGEPFFVPRQPDNPAAEEDDGYLMTYVHNECTEESTFIVMDAKSPNLEIVAAVRLPQRVPYGFHGIFVSECDLEKL